MLDRNMLSILAAFMTLCHSVAWSEHLSADEAFEASGLTGGVVVHLDCGDGRDTTKLLTKETFLVQGLAQDDATVELARKNVRTSNPSGNISVDKYDGRTLPYADNLVNLIVCNGPSQVPEAEILRVLCPLGKAFINGKEIVKPWPDTIDEWSHFLHDPSGNAVSKDYVVGSPVHLQWEGGPKWARSHDHLSNLSAMVSAGGRLFYIIDDGSMASITLPPKWRLVARDAFNGMILWKKDLGEWEGILRAFRSGPTEIARRLVAAGNRVFVTLGYGEPVVALDAATGKRLRTYEGTEGAHEILWQDGVLYLVSGTIPEAAWMQARAHRGPVPHPENKSVLAVDADTGKVLWAKADEETFNIMPSSLVSDDGRMFFQNTTHLVCVDQKDGNLLWKAVRAVNLDRPTWSTPTVMVVGDVVFSADRNSPADQVGNTVNWRLTLAAEMAKGRGELLAYSAKTGEQLWSAPCSEAYTTGVDLFFADGLIWVARKPDRNKPDFTEGRDIKTGEVVRTIDTSSAFTATHHHRCYRNKATERYIFLGRSGTSTIDLKGKQHLRHTWVRGSCQYGLLPCNGLLYAPPHACACYIQSKLSGFFALSPKRTADHEALGKPSSLLKKGPAYGQIGNPKSVIGNSQDWPTYRHDLARSGVAGTDVPTQLEPAWKTRLGGKLTAPVVANGRLYAAAVERHTVYCLDATTGKQTWSYAASGRVDSPPAVAEGCVVFGSKDGWVYCLRESDGMLVWRFHAAPKRRYIVSYQQLESVWPVHGSVLVCEGTVYFTAGRSSYLDGGMVFYALDLKTGSVTGHKPFYSRDPENGAQLMEEMVDYDMPGGLPDILSSDGMSIFMRDNRYDFEWNPQPRNVPHLFSPAGFLDDSWWHRTYWQYGIHMASGPHAYTGSAAILPTGRIMSIGKTAVYGFGRTDMTKSGTHIGPRNTYAPYFRPKNFTGGYELFAVDRERYETPNRVGPQERNTKQSVVYRWRKQLPIWVKAMVVAGNKIIAAGHPDVLDEADPAGALEDRKGGHLMVLATDNAEVLSELKLDSMPVFDGMAAANRRVYIAQKNGDIICLGE